MAPSGAWWRPVAPSGAVGPWSQFPKIPLFRKGENFGMFYSGYSDLFRIFRFSVFRTIPESSVPEYSPPPPKWPLLFLSHFPLFCIAGTVQICDPPPLGPEISVLEAYPQVTYLGGFTLRGPCWYFQNIKDINSFKKIGIFQFDQKINDITIGHWTHNIKNNFMIPRQRQIWRRWRS